MSIYSFQGSLGKKNPKEPYHHIYLACVSMPTVCFNPAWATVWLDFHEATHPAGLVSGLKRGFWGNLSNCEYVWSYIIHSINQNVKIKILGKQFEAPSNLV